MMLDCAEIFNVPSDEDDFLGFELDIPMKTLSLENRNKNDNMPETSRMAMEVERDNNPPLIEEEEMETDSLHKKRRFQIQETLQLPKKIAKMSFSKCCSSDSSTSPFLKQTKNTNGRNTDQDTSSKSEADEAPDENSNVLLKREQNIKENKAVFAQLLADLESVASIPEINIPSSTKPKKASRKRSSGEPIQRQTNPTRSARPPENFTMERNPPVQWVDNETVHSLMRRKRILEVPKRRKILITGFRPVVTNEDLERIAYTNKEKIYDRILGTTCHQCRQKTIDTKTTCYNKYCVGVRGQFCGPCLRNRYGENVKVALLNPKWLCPPCRGVCNCSYCRKRDGFCATGTLIHLAKLCGYTNVREYLESMPVSHVNGNE